MQCTAHRKHNLGPCIAHAIIGGRVCYYHGGASRQNRIAGARRIVAIGIPPGSPEYIRRRYWRALKLLSGDVESIAQWYQDHDAEVAALRREAIADSLVLPIVVGGKDNQS